jgi:hypothetical protein
METAVESLAPGAMGVDDALGYVPPIVNDGSSVLLAGSGASRVLDGLPSDTTITVLVNSDLPSAPLIETGSIATLMGGGGSGGLRQAFEGGRDAAFLIGGQLNEVGMATGAIVQLANRAAMAAGTDTVWAGEYRDGGVAFVNLPGLDVGMQALCTPEGVVTVDSNVPAVQSPEAPVLRGLADGFYAPRTTNQGYTLRAPSEPLTFGAWRLGDRDQLVLETQQLMGNRDVFRLPSDYVEELDDNGLIHRDVKFAFWTIIPGDDPWAAMGWDFVRFLTAPVETQVKHGFTLGTTGLDDILGASVDEWRANHTGDLVTMNDAVTSINANIDLTQSTWIRQGIDALTDARNSLVRAMGDAKNFGEVTPDWVRDHPGVVEAKLDRDAQTLQQIDDSLASLSALRTNLAPYVQSLRELQYGPKGVFKGREHLLEPTSVLRLGGTLVEITRALAGVLLLAPPPDNAMLLDDGVSDDGTASAVDDEGRPTQDEALRMRAERNAYLESLPDDYESVDISDISEPYQGPYGAGDGGGGDR